MSVPKGPARRQRRNRPAALDVDFGVVDVPDPPAGLSARLAVAWRGLWCSPVAQLLDPVSDLAPVARLFGLYVLEERLVGAMDDPDDPSGLNMQVVNARLRLANELRQAESALGISPRARLALGLALLAGSSSGGGLDDAVDDADNE